MPQTIIQISDSPLARSIRQAVEIAYQDDRAIDISFSVKAGPGAATVTCDASALVRFSQANGLTGTMLQSGARQPLAIELPKEDGSVLFRIG